MSKDRGFKKLKGVTISKVDASCVNMVVLWDEEGKSGFIIGAEVINGVPVLTLTRHSIKKTTKLPERSTPARSKKGPTWPFPIEKDKTLD